MRTIKIVADSTCDLYRLEHIDFASTPMKVATDEREFIDTEDINAAEMVEYLLHYNGESRSSCPNTTDWLSAFGEADDIYCICTSSGASGSFNAANVAKQLYLQEHEDKRVFVLDTLSAGPEVTMIVKKLEELILEQLPFEEVCEKIRTYVQTTGLVFMLKSMRNLANNGRVSPIVARVAGLLGICVVGKDSTEGKLEPLHKCRGEKRAHEALVDLILSEGGNPGRVSIGHCENEAGAQAIKKMLLSKFPNAEVEIHDFRGICCFYAERGGILVGFEKG